MRIGLWIVLVACALPGVASAQRPLPATLERAASDLFLRDLHSLAPEPGTDWHLRVTVRGLSGGAATRLRAMVRREFGAALSADRAVRRTHAAVDSVWIRGDSAGVVLIKSIRIPCPPGLPPYQWSTDSYRTLHLFVLRRGRWRYAEERPSIHGSFQCLIPPRDPPPWTMRAHRRVVQASGWEAPRRRSGGSGQAQAWALQV